MGPLKFRSRQQTCTCNSPEDGSENMQFKQGFAQTLSAMYASLPLDATQSYTLGLERLWGSCNCSDAVCLAVTFSTLLDSSAVCCAAPAASAARTLPGHSLITLCCGCRLWQLMQLGAVPSSENPSASALGAVHFIFFILGLGGVLFFPHVTTMSLATLTVSGNSEHSETQQVGPHQQGQSFS